ncbi:OLC1v1001330C1 [Oldenlandia corymbosa var. corymbosa]|uniref:OLC1v1001330C1 n=1 Tax=Oldenlandia corymbosa var. corymbosa TaxID=529605 RepID=A0AAV1D5A6_OLDCO|nr:OLC1v1001330C1 [Oldenlandia corymbosa var. corymbosa]
MYKPKVHCDCVEEYLYVQIVMSCPHHYGTMVPDGDENDPVVLVSRSKGKGKFQLCDEDENYIDENDPGILVSRTKQKEIQILVEDDGKDFPVIRVSRTRWKGKYHILDEDEGEDVPVTTTVDGEAENVVPKAKALPCEYCQMISHWTAQCPQEQLTHWLENEISAEEHDDATDNALEPRADCSGNLDMDERKDQNEETLKVIIAPDEPAVETLNLVPDDYELYWFWDQCSVSGWICQHCYGEFKHGEWEELSNLPPTRKRMGRYSKVSEENLGPTIPSPRRFSQRLRGRLLWAKTPMGAQEARQLLQLIFV